MTSDEFVDRLRHFGARQRRRAATSDGSMVVSHRRPA